MKWQKVKVGDFLIRVKDLVPIIDNEEYNLVTIKLYHKGVQLRKKVRGSEMQAEKMSKVKAGQFILSGIDARNGAFGIIPNELHGAVVTNDFWHFEIDTNIISNEYFLWLTSTPYFDDICNKASDGTTNRIRLQADRFYSQELMIPAIQDQHKVVEELKSTNNKIKSLETEYHFQLSQISNLNQAILQEAVQGKLVKQDPKDLPDRQAGEPASELLKRIKAEKAKSGKKEKSLPPIKPEEIPFEIPENWVWCRLGEITDYGSSPKAEPSDLKNDTWVLDLEDIEKTSSNLLCKIRFNERNSLSIKSRFKAGDVLYSKLRPYLDKVIVADEDGVCTTEILPLKCYADLNPYYFKYSLKRGDFLKYVNSVTKGMKMPRLGTKEGQLALIPLPPLSEQKRIVVEIEKKLTKTKQLKEHIIANQHATEQLLKALLHQAFLPVPQAGEVEEMVTV
jgi:type I restriction enzyme S subunit